MRGRFLILTIITILVALLAGSIGVASAVEPPTGATIVNLVAGQNRVVGSIYIWNDNDTIYVQYETIAGWYLLETHFHIAPTWGEIPQTRNNNPMPGQFTYSGCFDISEQQQEWAIGFPIPEGMEYGDHVAVAAHAVVTTADGRRTETAWGEGTRFDPRRSWGMWFEYIINTPPVAVIAYAPEHPIWCDTITFDASGSYDPDGDPITYEWDFDYDGVTFDVNSTEMIANHFYGTIGDFTVALRVTDDQGAWDVATETVTLTNTPPVADFDVSGYYQVWCEAFYFVNWSYDADPCDTLDYHWDFGDGSTSTVENPVHTYYGAGTFTVTLTVTDGMGAVDSYSVQVETYNTPPVASFNPANGYLAWCDQPFEFWNWSYDDDDCDFLWLTYHWDFGDGNTSSAFEPTHTYAELGYYTVTLTVTDGAGESSNTASYGVEVYSTPPVADFVPVNGNLPWCDQPFDFWNWSYDPDACDWWLTYHWDFGDGNTSSAFEPTHTYAELGYYTVTLTVTDGWGASSTASYGVQVTNTPPVADFVPVN